MKPRREDFPHERPEHPAADRAGTAAVNIVVTTTSDAVGVVTGLRLYVDAQLAKARAAEPDPDQPDDAGGFHVVPPTPSDNDDEPEGEGAPPPLALRLKDIPKGD